MRYFLFIVEFPVILIELASFYIAHWCAIFRDKLYSGYKYENWLKKDLEDCESILELGCGSNSPLLRIGYDQKTTALEIFEPYIEKHKEKGHYQDLIWGDILAFEYPEKSYDAIVACDVFEHLEKDKVAQTELFKKIEKCAKKKVIIFTPNGFTENDEVDDDPYQKHLSAWEPEDFKKQGYKVFGATGIRGLLGKAAEPEKKPFRLRYLIALWLQPIIFKNPKIAFHSYAIKEIQNVK